jgi:hypothetical protein
MRNLFKSYKQLVGGNKNVNLYCSNTILFFDDKTKFKTNNDMLKKYEEIGRILLENSNKFSMLGRSMEKVFLNKTTKQNISDIEIKPQIDYRKPIISYYKKDIKYKNKYLKYKQKYLELKAKLNR